MKKIGLGVLITFIFAVIFELSDLWQAMVIAGFLGGTIVRRSWQAFVVGFSGVVICWIVILIYAEIRHQIIPLMNLTAQIFMLPEKLSFLFFLGTLLVGGMLGGLGGLNGWWWRKVAVKN